MQEDSDKDGRAFVIDFVHMHHRIAPIAEGELDRCHVSADLISCKSKVHIDVILSIF